MDELCKKLTGTYNTNFLDNYDPEIGKEFLKASEKYKNSGKGKNILMNLIHNHFEPKKEYPKFIGGPKTLTLQWNDDYQMMIYIFGEYHTDEMNCDKIKGFDSSLYTIMPIEEFLAKVITETDAFIDLYIEVPAYLKEPNEYKDSFKPFPDAYRLSELLKKFRKCIQYTTRAAKECKLARVHYFDIRYKDINGGIEPVNDIGFVKIYIQMVNRKKESEKIASFKLLVERSTEFQKILNGSADKDIRKSMDFWKSYIYTNSFITKEIGKIKDLKLRQKILDFIENELLNELLLCQLVLNTSSKIIFDYMAGHKVSDIIFIDSFNTILPCLISFNAIIVDAYTIARIFKDFDMTEMQKKAYKGSIDHPVNAHNIIIYAGDEHCVRYRKFLQSIGFKQYGKSGDFGISVTTCLNISNFKTPFFSELPPILR